MKIQSVEAFAVRVPLDIGAATGLAAAGVIRSTRVRHPTASLSAESIRELELLRARLPQ